MQRDKQETVSSFLKIKGDGISEPLIIGLFMMENIGDTIFGMTLYPKYKTNSLKHAIEKYWDQYYFISESLEKKFPKNFRIFNIQNFSSEKGQLEILQFCKFQIQNYISQYKKYRILLEMEKLVGMTLKNYFNII